MPGECASGHAEDIIQLFQRSLLSLRHEEEYHKECHGVQSSVETERARWRECTKHVRECKGKRRCPEVVCGHCPGHAHVTMGQREYLCRIGERHWTLAGRVEDIEQVDERRDHAQVGLAVFGNPEAESGSQQCPAHIRERGEQKPTTAVSIDGSDGGPGEEEVDQSKSPGGKESFHVAGTGLLEDGGRIEGDDIDCGAVDVSMGFRRKHSKRIVNSLPHICWAIIAMPEAWTARRSRGVTNSW